MTKLCKLSGFTYPPLSPDDRAKLAAPDSRRCTHCYLWVPIVEGGVMAVGEGFYHNTCAKKLHPDWEISVA